VCKGQEKALKKAFTIYKMSAIVDAPLYQSQLQHQHEENKLQTHTANNRLEMMNELSLEDVIGDAHMHSIFLQYLSTHDKKGFARLLFL
jgi:hypothetical protein